MGEYNSIVKKKCESGEVMLMEEKVISVLVML